MRLLLYNIAYGTGSPTSYPHGLFTLHRYLRSSPSHLRRIQEFVLSQSPDILGLVEVDAGSLRCGRRNQVVELAKALTHHHSYGSKYGQRSICRYLPILRHQGNAVLARDELQACRHHFFHVGFKRLIVEVQVLGVTLYLVHLALKRRIRTEQIHYLTRLIGRPREPVILAGDFNVFSGVRELESLMQATGLRSANTERLPTYPCWAPRRELDVILYSPQVNVSRFSVPQDVRLSDHLPLVLDFEVGR